MGELKMNYKLKCHICHDEVYSKQIGLHYNKKHNVSLSGDTYREYFEHNFPGVLSNILDDIKICRISVNQAISLPKYEHIPAGFHARIREMLNDNNIVSRNEINIEKQRRRLKTNLHLYGKNYSDEFANSIGNFKLDNRARDVAQAFWNSERSIIHRKKCSEYFSSDEFKNKRKITLELRYGVGSVPIDGRRTRTRLSKWHSKCRKLLQLSGINSRSEVYIKQGPFYIDELIEKYNICIEFNGDYWHMNPKIYSPEDFNPTLKVQAKYIWEHELLRDKRLNEMGYTIFKIWESDNIQEKIIELKSIISQYIDI